MEGYLDNVAAEVQSGPSSPVRLTDGEASTSLRQDDGAPPVAIDEIIAFFRRRWLAVGDSVVGPVHGPDSPQFAGDFISYRTDEYGSAFHYDNDSRASGYVEYEEFLQSGLAQRLRFWDRRFELSTGELDGVIDDRPPYREKPITAKRPLSDDEYGTFVSDTKVFIKRELRDHHEERLETVFDRGMDPSGRESGVARPRRIVFDDDQSVLCRVRRPPSADRRRRESIEEAPESTREARSYSAGRRTRARPAG